MKNLIWASLLCLAFSAMAQGQTIEAGSFGKGILNLKAADSSWTMKFGARMQILGTAGWTDSDAGINNPDQNFLIRRARLKFDGYALTPRLKYKLELGLSNRDISGASGYTNNAPRYILDAVVKWNFYENFELWFGQTKLPGNRERVISSANLSLVDRSLLNSRYNIDRDIGLQLHHTLNLSESFIITEALAFSQGEGRNVTTGNLGGHQYTGRIEVYPFGEFLKNGDYVGSDLVREQTPKLAIGATYDFNHNAVKTRSNLGRYMDNDLGLYQTDISTFFLDAMFKYKGMSVMIEYADRKADDPFAKNSDGSLTGDVVLEGDGLNLQAGYLFTNDWEITGRYTNIGFETNITNPIENQYTLGLSKFVVGHKLKIQTDFSYLDNAIGNNALLYRLQFEIHF